MAVERREVFFFMGDSWYLFRVAGPRDVDAIASPMIEKLDLMLSETFKTHLCHIKGIHDNDCATFAFLCHVVNLLRRHATF